MLASEAVSAVEALERLLGLGDQRLLARHVAGELLDAGLELALPVGRALRLALEVLLLDPEAGEDGALGRLLVAQRLQLAAASASALSALASASVARPTFSSAAARLASSASTWACASAQRRCSTMASSLRISAEISL